MTTQTDQQTIDTILNRATTNVLVRKDLEKKLKSGKSLRIKLGIDPTGSDLTLGHSVVLRKLKQYQDAGHHIILLFGSFTAQIGDPTGKSKTREPLTKEQVLKNAATYIEQASKVLDMDKVEVVYNDTWLEKLGFQDILELASVFTASQMMQRDMFQERIKAGNEVNLVEFLYPLMVSYDSVAIKADVEAGGSDQYFNLLCGRPMQEHFEQAPQNIFTTKLLVGTDGKEKMSKSLGNYIALTADAKEIFGKIMSVPDSALEDYYECLTDFDMEEAKAHIASDPRGAKIKLAQDIITWLHDEASAEMALKDFETKFVKKEIPDDIDEFKIEESEIGILDLITKVCNFAGSNSDARRLVTGGGVSINRDKIEDPRAVLNIEGGEVLKVGKRKFGKLVKV